MTAERPHRPNLDKPQLRTRQPTSEVPPPFVLIEGEEKAGKTWAAIQLSASPKVGDTYVLDLGEGSADEYGAIPGARYQVLIHDGTYAAVLEQVLAVRELASAERAAQRPPVVLIIDTMTDVWDGLKDWVGERAKAKPSNQKKLAQDPAAELDVPRNLWNDAGNRYRRLMNLLLTFPGIVIGTAKGKPISDTDPNTGQPYRDGRKAYRVEGEKNLAYAATVWLRMTRDSKPLIVGARSVHAGVKPGADQPAEVREPHPNLLEWLIFDVLRYDPAKGTTRDVHNLRGGELTDEERADEAAEEAKQAPPAARPPVAQQQQEARQQLLDRQREQVQQRREQSQQEAPAPRTLEQELQAVEWRRDNLNAQRKGPYAAMARALDAVKMVYPLWTREECVDEIEAELIKLGTTKPNATPEHYTTLAERWEKEEDDRIRARHAAAAGDTAGAGNPTPAGPDSAGDGDQPAEGETQG